MTNINVRMSARRAWNVGKAGVVLAFVVVIMAMGCGSSPKPFRALPRFPW